MGGAETTDDGYFTLYAEQSDRLKPFTVLMSMVNAPASWIGLEYGLKGPNLTYSTACSSSAVAIGEAARRIASGEVDVMIAGGAEAPLTFGTLKAWKR
jgi:3-oxoacyl-[acyl-carrier-protein] synthase II